MSTRERTRLISTDRIAGSVYVEGGTVTGLPAALGQATAALSTPVVLANNLNVPSALALDGANVIGPAHPWYSIANVDETVAAYYSGSVVPSLWDGSVLRAQRANVDAVALASAARTATANTPDIVTYNARGITVLLNVTANPGGAETLSLKIQAKESIGGAYIDIADAGILFTAANGLKGIEIYPGILSADLVAGLVGKSSSIVGRTVRAVITHSSTGSWTYSVSSILLV